MARSKADPGRPKLIITGEVVDYEKRVGGRCYGQSTRKCIRTIRKDYANKHKVLYSSDCSDKGPLQKRACLRKLNKGLR